MKPATLVVALLAALAIGTLTYRYHLNGKSPLAPEQWKDALNNDKLGDVQGLLDKAKEGNGVPASISSQEVASSYANFLNPADALDETKVGVAAKFVTIKPGEFEMGSPKDDPDRFDIETQHLVKLTKGYEMQATAVTQIQYFLVMGSNPSTFKEHENCDANNFKVVHGLGLCVNHPVENVSWDDAQQLIERLNKTQDKYTYRLPTEAEWENAARAGMPSRFPYSFGFNDKNELKNYAWYPNFFGGDANSRTHAVATKKANQWGLYDMYGNVSQWVNDYYHYYPTTAVQVDPAGPITGRSRVCRGGGYYGFPSNQRSAQRYNQLPDYSHPDLGFRLVRSAR